MGVKAKKKRKTRPDKLFVDLGYAPCASRLVNLRHIVEICLADEDAECWTVTLSTGTKLEVEDKLMSELLRVELRDYVIREE
jgi:hypothetical protein